ncbi:MarR family transcriptional regulator [Brevundimonas sp. EAKA]|jgi:MarR family transcriptional regulator, organic hydroperoxide resistance regulator|uniref:MarR family transcriptional regulator n=1 Tax=Brevundimonas mediterranea TaxID=74329 RepID=A0A6G7EK09_9CAUL|nr:MULTISPECIES: MarR family transcriptional regulator [Brevundimonas]MBU4196936.1 MarR family transcriptional regulator [Alphaproteobacteria bacterium]OGN44755.1 MAG: MarR family transcriptional regulator [Caulobacterales bacterium GWE1_67_11]OGN48119.1 MAG: MarR family transcriptional regulator [Caulobacterales bacterium RIFCSPHIGHO2_12_FULL_68_13]OYX81759.1 MAG: transcriptional regulator [Brevundimonas sp. 32-68-21]KDP93980.1 MarR family transcriptional regulator [Brevundimonas sp. EAKA]
MSKSKGPVPMEDQLCFTVYSTGMAIQRAYKPLLDDLGVTYPQYLVMNVLWREDGRTVGDIADELALEPSTMTPLLKRLEVAGLVRRARNPANERQVVITLTSEGQALRERAGCLGEALLDASGQTMPELSDLNIRLKSLRDAVYESLASRKSTQG